MAMYLSCVVVVLCAVAFAACQETYSDVYDNVNVDEILNNQRLYKRYIDCIMGNGKCTPDGQELKKKIPDALKTQCSKCNEKQKRATEKVLKFIITKKPEDYKMLEAKFDPEGVYRKRYDEKYKLIVEGKRAL